MGAFFNVLGVTCILLCLILAIIAVSIVVNAIKYLISLSEYSFNYTDILFIIAIFAVAGLITSFCVILGIGAYAFLTV